MEDVGGAAPTVNVKLLNIFLKFFYFVRSSQTHLQVCSQYQACTDVVPTFQASILMANQGNFQFLSTNLCQFIVTKEHVLRVLYSLKTFRPEIMPFISKHYDVLESTVTFRGQ